MGDQNDNYTIAFLGVGRGVFEPLSDGILHVGTQNMIKGLVVSFIDSLSRHSQIVSSPHEGTPYCLHNFSEIHSQKTGGLKPHQFLADLREVGH